MHDDRDYGDDDLSYRAVETRDPRFDGWFFVAVTSTGIYCRPSCASVTPSRANVRFFPTAAAAQRAGFRACKRCRPDASPGSPEWNRRGDTVGRAMQAIADGVVDRVGVAGLAASLGYSSRHLHRLLVDEVGAGPLDLARAQRAQTARILLETTALSMSEVAFASGFGSVRQFNDTVRSVFAEPPSALRARVRTRSRAGARSGAEVRAGVQADGVAAGAVVLRLAFRPPFAASYLLSFLAERAVPGVEAGDATRYRRSLRLAHGFGVLDLEVGDGEAYCRATLRLEDLRDLTSAVKRARTVLDLDADPQSVLAVLGSDPLLAPSLAARPGLRIPGHVDGREIAMRAVLGQQVSVAGARAAAAKLTRELGEPLPRSLADGDVSLSFPTTEAIAEAPPEGLPMPRSRARALQGLAAQLSDGTIRLEPGVDRDEVSRQLLAMPGIGPWTVAYIRMRALVDPDAFLASDLGVRRALERAGERGDPRSATAVAERWRPYRSYALQHLWAGPIASTDADPTSTVLKGSNLTAKQARGQVA